MKSHSSPAASKIKLPRSVLALGITSLLTDIGSEMIFPLLPMFVASLGAAPAFLGLVEGLADATSSLLKLGSGYLTDRRRAKKPLVVAGYLIAALTRPLVAIASVPLHVLAIRVTDRIGKGIRSTPRDVLIANSVPREHAGRAFGFHRAMDHTGAVIGPLVAALLLEAGVPLRTVFALAIIPGLLSVLAVLTVDERANRANRPSSDESTPAAGGAAGLPQAGLPQGGLPEAKAATLPLPARLRSYLLIVGVFCLGNSTDAFLLLRARDLGLSIASIPLLWTVFHVAKVGSSYFGGALSDRVARPKLVLIGWVIYAAIYLGFGAAREPSHVWILFILYGLYYGLTEPSEKALVSELAPEAVRGRAFGYYNFVLGASAVPAGVLTGWLWQTMSPQAALHTGAAIALVSAISLALWSRSTA